MDDVEYVYTTGIDETEIDRLLRDRGHGVIAVCRETDAYAVPINYAFDDGRLLIRMSEESDSTKIEYAKSTETATLVVYEVTDETGAWSIVVRGELGRLTAGDRDAFSDADINELFPPFRLFDETVPDVDIALYEMVPRTITGRRTA